MGPVDHHKMELDLLEGFYAAAEKLSAIFGDELMLTEHGGQMPEDISAEQIEEQASKG
ncbi:hypothetical protein D3C87_2172750 [compost metagenome]